MKKLYWRPRGIPRSVLVLIAIISLIGLLAVELLRTEKRQPYFDKKLEAAKLAAEGMELIKKERLARGVEIHPELDPTQSGLIGSVMTPVTTVIGSISAKQTSVNPNFAAVVLEMLKKAKVREGDVVAVGCSGSFPALNICVYAAMRTLQLKPIIISSISASQFGANDPDFLWIDMERVLNEREKEDFPYRTMAVSLGGVEDRALGMSKQGQRALDEAITRNGLSNAYIKPANFKDSIDKHMALFARKAGGTPIKAYINIGGGATSVGTSLGKRMFQPGLNEHSSVGASYVDSVMTRFIEQRIPLIHLTKIEDLANRYGLPLQPTTLSPPGEGGVFKRKEYDPWLAAGVLFVIMASLYVFVRSGIGSLVLQTSHKGERDLFHEPMV